MLLDLYSTHNISYLLENMQQYGLLDVPWAGELEVGELTKGTAMMFEPLPGFHFGTYGPIAVAEEESNDFFCDVPLLVIVLVLAGQMAYTVSGKTYSVKKNMVFIGPWGNDKGVFRLPVQEEYTHIGFMIESGAIAAHFGQRASERLQKKLKTILGNSNQAERSAGMVGLASPGTVSAARGLLSYGDKGMEGDIAFRGAIVDFFAKLLQNISEQEDNTKASPILEQDILSLARLKERIEREFLGLPHVAELCKEIGMSESKANRNFKRLFSVTIARYILQCKLVYAHTLLTEHKMNVSQAAFAVGYSNIGHFITAFKKYYGATPKDVSRLD